MYMHVHTCVHTHTLNLETACPEIIIPPPWEVSTCLAKGGTLTHRVTHLQALNLGQARNPQDWPRMIAGSWVSDLVRMQAPSHTCAHVHACTHTHKTQHTQIHAYARTHAHAHTHTHTHLAALYCLFASSIFSLSRPISLEIMLSNLLSS